MNKVIRLPGRSIAGGFRRADSNNLRKSTGHPFIENQGCQWLNGWVPCYSVSLNQYLGNGRLGTISACSISDKNGTRPKPETKMRKLDSQARHCLSNILQVNLPNVCNLHHGGIYIQVYCSA